ncbi:MAG: NUDIX hydrolase [Casimicrobium sp.]
MNTEQIASLRGMLGNFSADAKNVAARSHVDQIASFMAGEAQPWSRATLEGHLTASAWVLDRTRSHAAMIHHRKLGRWLQPGGHIEDGDASWRAAAQREVTEEVGLTAFIALPDAEQLFDVDVHSIPARIDVPAHFHYDLRVLFIADVDAGLGDQLKLNLDEASDCRWFRLTDLASEPALELSLRRMVELSIRNFS